MWTLDFQALVQKLIDRGHEVAKTIFRKTYSQKNNENIYKGDFCNQLHPDQEPRRNQC